jgi:predicted nucleotidyltransferase
MSVEGTPRGSEYRRKLHLVERRKLTIARDIDGEPLLVAPKPNEIYGSEAHEFMRRMDENLSKVKGFIGLTLTGSMMRGHADSGSDIDTMLFIDDEENPNAFEEVEKVLEQQKNILRRGPLKRDVDRNVTNLHIPTIRSMLMTEKKQLDKNPQARHMYFGVVNLCGVAIGPHVAEYRTKIGNILRELPMQQRDFWIGHFAAYALELEKNSEGKRGKRIERYDERNEKKRALARYNLWKNKITNALGLSEQSV